MSCYSTKWIFYENRERLKKYIGKLLVTEIGIFTIYSKKWSNRGIYVIRRVTKKESHSQA